MRPDSSCGERRFIRGSGAFKPEGESARPKSTISARNHRPRVLHISRRPDVSATRSTAYNRAGCQVTLVRHVDEVLRACAGHAFDVAVIDCSVPFEDERRIVAIIRSCMPEATVLTDPRKNR